jgi:hypothetical protein
VCGFCGARDVHDAWIASHAEDGRSQSFARARAAAAATSAFAPLRVTVRAWSGRFIVSSATGRSLIVDQFTDVVAAAATVAQRRIDSSSIGAAIARHLT